MCGQSAWRESVSGESVCGKREFLVVSSLGKKATMCANLYGSFTEI